jgi:hypothetical protein
MEPSNADLVVALRALSQCELAEVVYAALEPLNADPRYFPHERWCLAYATFDPAIVTGSYVELVGLPMKGAASMQDVSQQGGCSNCGTQVLSAAKRAICPVCMRETSCS